MLRIAQIPHFYITFAALMLKRLHIRNYALIDELDIDFSKNLTIITGETGAGKSIVLGALGLIMGERAESKIFYNDQEKCVVEGHFEVASYGLQEFFNENELDYDDEVVIRASCLQRVKVVHLSMIRRSITKFCNA